MQLVTILGTLVRIAQRGAVAQTKSFASLLSDVYTRSNLDRAVALGKRIGIIEGFEAGPKIFGRS